MASGKFGNAVLTAATWSVLYTVPTGMVSTANINVCNRSESIARVRIAIAAGIMPGNAECIEYDALLNAHGVLERTGIVCSAGEKIVVWADAANVSVRVHGFEEPA